MKSLIIGAQGLVGSALKRKLPDAIEGIQVEAAKPNQYYVDIMKYETLFKVFSEERPAVVYLPAAITNVDKCENTSTDVVNIRGAVTVLRLCEQFGSKLVYFSSSYVFDGTSNMPYSPQDEVHPINHYGEQKVFMENLILSSDAQFVIIRTVGVFGKERRNKNFAKFVSSSVLKGEKVFVPSDQYMNPILSDDLARISIKLAEKENGIFHVAGDTCFVKSDFAKKIASRFGKENMVIPTSSEKMKQAAHRPSMGCLEFSALEETLPSLDNGLDVFFDMEFNE